MAFGQHLLMGLAGEFSYRRFESQELQTQLGHLFSLLFKKTKEQQEEVKTASVVNICSRKSFCGFLIEAPNFSLGAFLLHCHAFTVKRLYCLHAV